MASIFRKTQSCSRFKQKLTLGVSMALGVAFGTALKSVVFGVVIAIVLWRSSDNRPR